MNFVETFCKNILKTLVAIILDTTIFNDIMKLGQKINENKELQLLLWEMVEKVIKNGGVNDEEMKKVKKK